MTRRVFLTGITGHLGYHVALELLERGYSVIALARDPSVVSLADHLTIVRGDITVPEGYVNTLSNCDLVIHAAALVSFGGSADEHERLNAKATVELVTRAAEAGVDKFVYVSSRGTRASAPVPEDSNEDLPFLARNRRDAYIDSKVAAEQAVLAAADRLEVAVVSPTALIGGRDHKPGPAGWLVRDFIEKGAGFYLDGGLNLIDVRDAAAATVTALQTKNSANVFFLAGHNVTMADLYGELSKITGRRAPLFCLPTVVAWCAAVMLSAFSKMTGRSALVTPSKVLALKRRQSYCDNSRAVGMLAMKVTPLAETLDMTVRYFQVME